MTEPLAGRRIVVTRAPHQAADLAEMLAARGAAPLLYPCIDIDAPEDPSALDAALTGAAAGAFDWLVVTSRNTVMAIERRLVTLGLAPEALAAMRVAAVGPATAQAAAETLGLTAELVPEEHVAEALAAALIAAASPGRRVLLPQSAIARAVLAESLSEAGLIVTAVPAYRTVTGRGGEDVPALLAAGQVDAVTFTSSSTVDGFLERLAAEGGLRDNLAGVCLACIGPIAARTAEGHGLRVHVVPEDDYTLDGLLDGLESYFAASYVKDANTP